MTIYLDVVLIENLCMNYIILFANGYLLKKKISHIRLILSGLSIILEELPPILIQITKIKKID